MSQLDSTIFSFPVKCQNCANVAPLKAVLGTAFVDLWQCVKCRHQIEVCRGPEDDEEEGKHLYTVTVEWTSAGSETFTVRADSEEEAKELAQDMVEIGEPEDVEYHSRATRTKQNDAPIDLAVVNL